MKNTKGFTLIELLVVVLIIGILAAIALPQYLKTTENSKIARILPTVKAFIQAYQACVLEANGGTCTIDDIPIQLRDKNGNLITTASLGTTGATTGTFLDNYFYLSWDGGTYFISRTTYGGPYYFRWYIYPDGRCVLQGNVTCPKGVASLDSSGFKRASQSGDWVQYKSCFPGTTPTI